jgi:hypothetical protein
MYPILLIPVFAVVAAMIFFLMGIRIVRPLTEDLSKDSASIGVLPIVVSIGSFLLLTE